MGKKKKKGIGCIVALLVFLVVILCAVVVLYNVITKYKINEITFEGTDRYTDEQLKEFVFSDLNSSNMLKLKYDLRDYEKVTIPFIETYEITLTNPDKVHVVFYEKKIVAYVLYKENYMYFDKDGIIVETSNSLLADVPMVDGLEFNSIVLYNPLPVKDEKVFNTILDLSQNLVKYDIRVDKIHFENDLSIVLYMDEVRVNLGDGTKLVEKLNELKSMEEGLRGLKGVLHMENFEEGTNSITFKRDKE